MSAGRRRRSQPEGRGARSHGSDRTAGDRAGDQPVSRGQLRTDPPGDHRREPRGDRRASGRPGRHVHPHGLEPALPSQRPLPLVRRRRNAARNRARGRQRHLPQPLHPHEGPRGRHRRRELASHRHHGAARHHQPGWPVEGHRQHRPRVPLRQAARAVVAVRKGAPDPAPRFGDRGPVRLRRHARHQHGLARQGRSGHGRHDLHRLRPAAALPALRRRVSRRRGGALDADRAARLPAPARRRLDGEPRAAVRHVDDVGPGGDEAGPRTPRLLPRAPEPDRRDPAPRRGHGRALVRDRAVLHVPHDRVLGRGRGDRDDRLPDPRSDGLGSEG